jgi:hypothetical protein
VVRIRDPGSGKKSSRIRIPDPRGKKAPDPGSGSATLSYSFVKGCISTETEFRVLIAFILRATESVLT